MQPVQKCGLLSVYSNSQVLVRGAFLWEYFRTAMLSGVRRVVSTSEHFEPKALFILILWAGSAAMLLILALESFREALCHVQWPRPLSRARHIRTGAMSQPQACCVTVSLSLFCWVLFLSLLRRQQYLCTSQWEHPLLSQHVFFCHL